MFITTATAMCSLGRRLHILPVVPRSTQPSTLHGMVKWVSAFVINRINSHIIVTICSYITLCINVRSTTITVLNIWSKRYSCCTNSNNVSVFTVDTNIFTVLQTVLNSFLWSPYVIGQTIIFLPCHFYLLFFPHLISAVGDWMSSCLPYFYTWCGPSANLECMPETCCARLAENTGRKNDAKTPSGHHRTTLSGYIFATKACIDNRKKNLLSIYMSSTSS